MAAAPRRAAPRRAERGLRDRQAPATPRCSRSGRRRSPAHPAQASEHQPRPRRLSMWTGVGLRRRRRASVATVAPPPLLPHGAPGPPRRRPELLSPSGSRPTPTTAPSGRNPSRGGGGGSGPCVASAGPRRGTNKIPSSEGPMADPACERFQACLPVRESMWSCSNARETPRVLV